MFKSQFFVDMIKPWIGPQCPPPPFFVIFLPKIYFTSAPYAERFSVSIFLGCFSSVFLRYIFCYDYFMRSFNVYMLYTTYVLLYVDNLMIIERKADTMTNRYWHKKKRKKEKIISLSTKECDTPLRTRPKLYM